MRFRIVVVSILLLAFVTAAYAQKAAVDRTGVAKNAAVRLAKQLGLTKEQAKQIREIVVKYRQDVAAEIKSGDTADQKKAKIKELRDSAAAAIMAVLNDEQKAKAEKMHLTALLLEPRARLKAGLMAMLAKLNLTEEQKTSIKSIAEQAKTAAKAIKDDSSLDKAAKRAKLVELKRDTQAKIMAVLNPDQQQQLKKMMADAKERIKNRVKNRRASR